MKLIVTTFSFSQRRSTAFEQKIEEVIDSTHERLLIGANLLNETHWRLLWLAYDDAWQSMRKQQCDLLKE